LRLRDGDNPSLAGRGQDSPAKDEDGYLRAIEACLNVLSKTCDVRTEQVDGRKSFLVRFGGNTRRIVFWREPYESHYTQDHLIVLGWGTLPMAFSVAPNDRVEYLDLQFETHSRALGEIGLKLKNCLEARGYKFREFDSSVASTKSNTRYGRLRGKMKRMLTGQVGRRGVKTK
jgi:hypothetical protein